MRASSYFCTGGKKKGREEENGREESDERRADVWEGKGTRGTRQENGPEVIIRGDS